MVNSSQSAALQESTPLDALEQLITKDDVLRKTKISKTALWEAVKDGRFPTPVRLGPRTVRWKLSDIQNFIDRQQSVTYQPNCNIPALRKKGKR